MGYAFISYSSKNKDYADALRDFLKGSGVKTWMAPRDIPPGEKYASVINQALKNCSCLILVLSKSSQESIWVGKEVERAVNYRKPVIPVQIEDVVLSDDFELYISTDQIIAIPRIDKGAEGARNLLSSVQSFTRSEVPADESAGGSQADFCQKTGAESISAKNAKVYTRRRPRIYMLICCLAVIAACIIGVVCYMTSTDPSGSVNTPAISDENTPADEKEMTVVTVMPSVRAQLRNASGEIREFTLNNENHPFSVSSQDTVIITASCTDHDLALKWAADNAFMEEKGFRANDKGMARLGYIIVPSSSDYKALSDAVPPITQSEEPTRAEISLSDLQPGYYLIGIDAVGAVDGLTDDQDGVTYESSTGWNYLWIKIE